MLGSCTKVLIVEDDVIISFMMENMVEDLGYWVEGPVHDLAEGVRRAADADIDFALLDYELGNRTTSLPIAEALTRRGIPFAFTTGHTASAIRELVPNASILAKPILPSDLERVLPV
jgi:CheY-like chemotaxis protein